MRRRLADPAPLGEAGLAELLRLLAERRHRKIADTMARDGTEGGHAPRLPGCCEAALQPPPAAAELPDWLRRMSHRDRLLAVREGRQAPTPWLILEPD